MQSRLTALEALHLEIVQISCEIGNVGGVGSLDALLDYLRGGSTALRLANRSEHFLFLKPVYFEAGHYPSFASYYL